MTDFLEGKNRSQDTSSPEKLDNYMTEDNAFRVIDVFIDDIDLSDLGFKTMPEITGRPAYHTVKTLRLWLPQPCPFHSSS